MKWRQWLKDIIIGLALVFIFSNIINYLRHPELSSTHLPEGTVTLIDGTQHRLKSGKPVVLHFWATWCRVCKVEAKNIDRLRKEYEVLTIAVNSGSDSEVAAYMKEQGVDFHVLNDREGEWAKRFDVTVFPTTFIYDSSGELAFSEVGYTTTAGLLARIKLVE